MYQFPEGPLQYPLTGTQLGLQASNLPTHSLILTFRAAPGQWASCLFSLTTLAGNEIVLLQTPLKSTSPAP